MAKIGYTKLEKILEAKRRRYLDELRDTVRGRIRTEFEALAEKFRQAGVSELYEMRVSVKQGYDINPFYIDTNVINTRPHELYEESKRLEKKSKKLMNDVVDKEKKRLNKEIEDILYKFLVGADKDNIASLNIPETINIDDAIEKFMTE